MEIAEYKVFAEKCFRDTLPPCAAVCPLAYDVREFIRLMRKGSLRSAYKLIRTSLIFPSIIVRVCPETCRKACVRGRIEDSIEESIDLKSLEQICIDKMAGKDPDRYNIPQKSEHVAVIGGGLSGLACAYRLASFGYQVRVYERNVLLGGNLPDHISKEWAHDEITREFKAVKCDFVLNTEIKTLTELVPDKEKTDKAGSAGDRNALFDAVYIASGADGSRFDDLSGINSELLIIRGGALAGADLMESVRMGLTAAEMINNELRTDKVPDQAEHELKVPERKADERYYSLNYDTSVPAEIPAKGAAEAFRCMRCNCSECYDVCPLMDKVKFFPPKMCVEIINTLKPSLSKRTSVRMIMGCTECGLCKEACPEDIDMGKCLSEARSDFYESGAMSPAFHDYWLQDMEFCESDEARLLYVNDQNRAADVLYFPGCQLSASMPEFTERSYEALLNVCDNPAVLLGCCGVPAKWAGHRERYAVMRAKIVRDWESMGRPCVVTACPSCLESLKDLHPDMEVISYYKFAADHPDILIGTERVEGHADTAVKVADPCSSNAESGMAEAVRSLLMQSGYKVLNDKAEPACCGFGGHIYNAVPSLHDTFAKRMTENLPGRDAVTAAYCANCRDILAYRGEDARHVLGMLFGVNEKRRMPPDLSRRRINRREVKSYFTHEELTEKTEKNEHMEIFISEELLRKMDRMLLLMDQVSDIINEAEKTDSKIYDEGDNVFIAHKKFGTVTVWVKYSSQAAGNDGAYSEKIVVENVYCHRMDIREE